MFRLMELLLLLFHKWKVDYCPHWYFSIFESICYGHHEHVESFAELVPKDALVFALHRVKIDVVEGFRSKNPLPIQQTSVKDLLIVSQTTPFEKHTVQILPQERWE